MRLTTFSMASSMPVKLSQEVFVLTYAFKIIGLYRALGKF